MGAKLGSGGGLMADMNVTPLIDVVLVLLVVFMVITPMLQSGLPVELPEVDKTTSATKVNASEFITVSITSKCPAGETTGCPRDKIGVEQEEATLDTMVELLNDEFAKDGAAYANHMQRGLPGPPPQPRLVLIKADGVLSYGAVREVMDVLGENKWTSLRLAVNERD